MSVVLFGSGAAVLAVLGTGGGMWLYRRRWRREAARRAAAEARIADMQALLASAPLGGFVFEGPLAGPFGDVAKLLSLDQDPADFAALSRALAPEDGARLADAAEGLRRRGAVFTLTVRTADGRRSFAVQGVIGPSGPAVWLADITVQEDARRTATARHDVLREGLDLLPLPVWRRDAALNLVDCNESYARAVDRPRAEAIAGNTELLGESLKQAGRALANRALESEAPARESHHVVVDGSRRLMEVMEVPLPDGSLIGFAVDRTRVEELQNELARHISAHGEVLETLGTAIAIYGPDLRLKFYNGAYVDMWGLDEAFLDEEPQVSDVMEALRERRRLPEQTDFPAFRREAIQAMRNLVQPSEELMHRPDGSTLKLTMSPHPFGGVIIIYENVTDRLTLERNFNTLIEVQRATIDNLYEAVAVFGPDGRLALSNRAYTELWGFDLAALGDRPHVRDLVEASRHLLNISDDAWDEICERIVVRATEPEARSGRLERLDGKVLEWAQVPLPDGQSLFSYLDVTDSVTVQRALRERAEALETADRLKSEFIANISYELRTPLNAIVGFAEILENQFFGPLNQRQQDYAQAIVQSSQRLIGLINDILDLSTIEAGYLELDLEEVDVAALMNDLMTLAHERAHNRSIALDLDCPADIGTLVGDGRRIKQAMFNLLSNAFNYTPEGGQVLLSARRSDDGVALSVRDTGVGIPEEEQSQVFDRFTRGAARKSGAGLGLSLVKSLVELHGGGVEMESEPKAGTRVTCRLPLEACRPKRQVPPPPQFSGMNRPAPRP